NSTVLLIGRLLQGVAAGIQMPQVLGLIQQLFQGKERGRAFGLFGATIGVSTALGPTLGGLLIALGGPQDGWRWIFCVNIPLCLAIWMLPATRTRSHRRLELAPVGVLLFGITVFALMWPFLFTTGSPDDDPMRWWMLVVFVLFAAAFVAWERHYESRGKSPLVALRLFGISSFRNGTLLQIAYFTALPPLFLLSTLYLQDGLGLTALQAGFVTIGFALANAGSSWLGGHLVGRFGRPLVLWGLIAVLISVVLLTVTALYSDPVATAWIMGAVMALGGF